MKIVRFKNGTYGVRRWTIFGREFLDKDDPHGNGWWTVKYLHHYQTTREEAEKLFMVKKPKKMSPDYGEPSE